MFDKNILPSKKILFEASLLHKSFTVLQNEIYVKAQSLKNNADMFVQAVESEKYVQASKLFGVMMGASDFITEGIKFSDKTLDDLKGQNAFLKTEYANQRKIWGHGYGMKSQFDKSAKQYSEEKPKLLKMTQLIDHATAGFQKEVMQNTSLSYDDIKERLGQIAEQVKGCMPPDENDPVPL
tara:strand:- start:353 stop:895 length:543 start_codon:yes stop_codon:yes gene_type:complete